VRDDADFLEDRDRFERLVTVVFFPDFELLVAVR
jgi:hypothetical protein